MAIELQEYVGAKVNVLNREKKNIELTENTVVSCVDENSIMVDIEAIHSIITRNDTLYTEQCIKNSIPYWTSPYGIPVIMHHNEKDGVIIGRVKGANFIGHSQRSNTPALELVANIGDENGIKGIKNGTLSTVSIGAIAHDLRCSICGTNLAEEGLCEHEKGEYYNGKRCYWVVNEIEPKEVSYVIVPSDKYAHNTNVYSVSKKNLNEVNESMNIFDELIKEHGLDVIETATKEEVEETKEVEEVKETTEESEVKTETNKDDKSLIEDGSEIIKKEIEEEKQTETEKVDEVKESEEVNEDAEKTEDAKEVKVDEKVEEEKADKELEEAKAKIAELSKTVEDLKAEIKKLTAKVDSEKALRESAEAELVTFRTEKKKALIENINELRAEISLPALDVNSLIESNEEALQASIKNLKEFAEIQKKTLAGLQTIKSPVSVSEEADNTNKEKNAVKNVKEAYSNSNIDFESQLENIFNKCW